jgi:ADP-ribose pyrophosphatase
MKKVIPEDSVLLPDAAELKFKGMLFDVYQWPQKLFDGSEQTFEMLKRTDTVQAFCVVDDKIMILEDEQPHLGSRLSLPGGRIDDTDADALAAAQREIKEETGYEFKNWRLVRVWQPYRKIEWFINVFMAWDAVAQQAPKLDPGEKITPSEMSFEELKKLASKREGYLGDAWPVLEPLGSLADLLGLPGFKGQETDR